MSMLSTQNKNVSIYFYSIDTSSKRVDDVDMNRGWHKSL